MSAVAPKQLALCGFRCASCDLLFYVPQSDAGEGIKYGYLCPRCRDGENIHSVDWIYLGQITRVQGSDTERRCNEPITN
jgi:hypothetical protein